MHKFIRILCKGVVRRFILMNSVALLLTPTQAKSDDQNSAKKLKCTELDARKIYPYCMMYKGTLWCDQSKYFKVPSVKEINDHLIDNDCRTATVLYINDSCLGNLAASDLVQFHRITTLNVEENRLTSLHRDVFSGVRKLKSLNLGHNGIEELSVETFEHTENLEQLCLEDNLLSEIQDRLFQRLSRLKALRMRGNRIRRIHDHAFYGLRSLTHLQLDGNKLQRVTHYTFKYLKNLKVLTISHNELRSWPVAYGRILVNVYTLDLGHNLLSEFSSEHVANMTKLQNLSLEGNSLQKVDEDQFATTPRLGYLSLADNDLSDVPKKTFSGLCHLRQVFLSNNNLKTPRRQWWDGLNKDETVIQVDLRHNFWSCACEAKEYWEFLQTLPQGSRLLGLLDIDCGQQKKHLHRKLSELDPHDFETCSPAFSTNITKLATADGEKVDETTRCSEPRFKVQSSPQPFNFTPVTTRKPLESDLDVPVIVCLLLAALAILLLILVWCCRASNLIHGTREMEEKSPWLNNRRDEECERSLPYQSLGEKE